MPPIPSDPRRPRRRRRTGRQRGGVNRTIENALVLMVIGLLMAMVIVTLSWERPEQERTTSDFPVIITP